MTHCAIGAREEVMTKHNDGGPAFPREYVNATGMSLRDYFAAKAMQGFIAGLYANANNHGFTVEGTVVAAYEYADAMLAAREKRNG